MSRKLFVTDIDGTLLNDKVGLSQDVIDAAREFVELGNALPFAREGQRLALNMLPCIAFECAGASDDRLSFL